MSGQGGIQQETVQFDCCSFGRTSRPIASGPDFGGARTIYESFLIDLGFWHERTGHDGRRRPLPEQPHVEAARKRSAISL